MDWIVFAIAALGMIVTLLAIFSRRNGPEGGVPGPAFGRWTDGLSRIVPLTTYSRRQLAKDLVRGGVLHGAATANFLASRNLALLIWTACVAAVFSLEQVSPETWMLWTVVAVAVVIIGVPRVVVSLRAARRAQDISQDLPDVLDLVAMMMSGGMTMEESLRHAIGQFDNTHPPMAVELRIIFRQARTGTLDEALIAFAKRLDIPQVTALTSLLRGGHRAGGSMSSALRTFADGLRESRDQRARERGNKTAVQILLPVVFCLAPPIYILLLGPAFLSLRDFVEQQNMPGGALAPTVQNQPLNTTPVVRPNTSRRANRFPINTQR